MYKVLIFISLLVLINCEIVDETELDRDESHDMMRDQRDPSNKSFYQYEYGIDSEGTGDVKGLKEERDGDIVKGEYSVNDPDGFLRTVKYTVDAEKGFQAKVIRTKIENFQTQPQADEAINTNNKKIPVSTFKYVGKKGSKYEKIKHDNNIEYQPINYIPEEIKHVVKPQYKPSKYQKNYVGNYDIKNEQIPDFLKEKNNELVQKVNQHNAEVYKALNQYQNIPIINVQQFDNQYNPYEYYPKPTEANQQFRGNMKFKESKQLITELSEYDENKVPMSYVDIKRYHNNFHKKFETQPEKNSIMEPKHIEKQNKNVEYYKKPSIRKIVHRRPLHNTNSLEFVPNLNQPIIETITPAITYTTPNTIPTTNPFENAELFTENTPTTNLFQNTELFVTSQNSFGKPIRTKDQYETGFNYALSNNSAADKLEPVVQVITESSDFPNLKSVVASEDLPKLYQEEIVKQNIGHNIVKMEDMMANAPLYNLLDVHPRKYYRRRNGKRRISRNPERRSDNNFNILVY